MSSSFVTTVASTLAIWRERAATRRALAQLDERSLRDLGIDRGGAQWESSKPFWSP